MPKLSYEESVKEVEELQAKIKAHQDGKETLTDYVSCLKRLQFLRNSIRSIKKRETKEENNG